MKYKSLVAACFAALLTFCLFSFSAFAQAHTGAICKDGTTSTVTGRGACSKHGGVAHWLTGTQTPASTATKAPAPKTTVKPTATPPASLFLSATYIITKAITLKAGNLRAGPATTYAIVGKITQSQTITITGQAAGWYQLAPKRWVLKTLVRLVAQSQKLIATATPTTTPTPLPTATSTSLPTATPSVNYEGVTIKDWMNADDQYRDGMYHYWYDFWKFNSNGEMTISEKEYEICIVEQAQTAPLTMLIMALDCVK
jgi:hypothetical protein